LLLVNVPMALYLSTIHQAAPIGVMEYVSDNIQNNESVHFLMPCHSTPYYSHVHRNISMKFLDCSPSFEPNYVDEADKFKANPKAFLFNYYVQEALPDYIAIFNIMLPHVSDFFSHHHYNEVTSFTHSYSLSNLKLDSHHILLYKRMQV